MPKINNIEQGVLQIEGFMVRLAHRDGRDVHGAKMNIPSYQYQRTKLCWALFVILMFELFSEKP